MITGRPEAMVRLTHLPTGIEATCSFYRSQHQNRDMAYIMLRSKLWAMKNGFVPELSEVAGYSLPGDMDSPHELGEYRDPPTTDTPPQ